MRWNELEARLTRHAALGTLETYGEVDDGHARYPLLRFTVPGDATLVVTAGFHGDEQSGPISLAEHLPELVDHARAAGVGLTVYPCLNPSGFDALTRYNRLGERPNNDVLRYELPGGGLVGELPADGRFVRVHPHRGGPVETRALVSELLRLPTPAAALDLHQDPYIPGPLAYAYAFGDPAAYRPLMEAAADLVPVARERQVDHQVHTDAEGLIALHDGSVTDWFTRLGVPYAAALETTTDTDLAVACEVNRVWLLGFVDLAGEAQALAA